MFNLRTTCGCFVGRGCWNKNVRFYLGKGCLRDDPPYELNFQRIFNVKKIKVKYKNMLVNYSCQIKLLQRFT